MTIPDANFHGTPGSAILDSDLNKNNVQAGIAGEQQIDRILRHVRGFDKSHVFYSAKIPGRMFDADAMIASGKTVMVIDAKNWANNHHYKFTSAPDGATVVRRPIDQPNAPLEAFAGGEIHMTKQLTSWGKALPQSAIVGVLVVIGKNISVEGFPAFHVTTSNNLPALLARTLTNNAPPTRTVKTLSEWTWTPASQQKKVSFFEILRLILAILLTAGTILEIPWCWPGSILMCCVSAIILLWRNKPLLGKMSFLVSFIGAAWPFVVALL